jgi:pimeloyl-ACP methyl ester carboxylesterase
MEFDEIVVKADRLEYPALAAGEGAPVVCWHGFPDHPATFWPMAAHLVAAGRRVIAPFLRGLHPATADSVRYADALTLAADAAAVARAVAAMTGSPDGVDMIGHDLGAGMVHRVAAVWPECLRRGVTLAIPPPPMFPKLFTDPAQMQRSFYIFLFQVDGFAEAVLERNHRFIDHLWDTWSPGLGDFPHRELVRTIYGDPRFIRNALRMYRADLDAALQDPALSNLAQRAEATALKPLMLLGGANDGCIDPYFLRDAHAGLAAGSRIEILENAGHFLHLEHPEAVARLALQWFGPREAGGDQDESADQQITG